MEMSNVQRIQSFSFAFDEAVQAERIVPPLEDWGNKPYALDIATQMKDFGAAIAHNTELYNGSFLRHAQACAAKIANRPGSAPVTAVFQSIPGLALNAK